MKSKHENIRENLLQVTFLMLMESIQKLVLSKNKNIFDFQIIFTKLFVDESLYFQEIRLNMDEHVQPNRENIREMRPKKYIETHSRAVSSTLDFMYLNCIHGYETFENIWRSPTKVKRKTRKIKLKMNLRSTILHTLRLKICRCLSKSKFSCARFYQWFSNYSLWESIRT